MQLNRCPSCHHRLSIEQMAQDKAASDLLGLLIDLPEGIGRSLVVYLGLFRSANRDLANDRAYRLAQEVLSLSDNKTQLAAALNETVQSMRIKQEQGAFKPLTNHNYLKRVIETLPVPVEQKPAELNTALPPVKSQSKAAQTIELLKHYPTPEGVDDWFARTVCDALADLMVMGLDSVPASDTMQRVIERFITELWPKREWQKDNYFRGAARLRRAFIDHAEHSKRWPSVKDVLSMVPVR